LVGINPPSNFKDFTELADFAQQMDDVDDMVKFFTEENKKLDDPLEDEDRDRLLNAISKEIMEKQNEFNSDKCLEELAKIKPRPEIDDRITQALEFCETGVLSKDGSLPKMEMFIETKVFKYFDIPAGTHRQMGKIFRAGIRELVKSKKKQIATKQKFEAKVKSTTFKISEEFNNLYKISVSTLGNITIDPFYDGIARYVSNKLHTIVFNGNIFIFENGCYRQNSYAVKAEATKVLNGIMKNENSRDISKRLSDLMTYITNFNNVNEYPFNRHDNAFPVKNGVVVLDFENGTYELDENPDPEKWKFDYVIDSNFDRNVDSSHLLKTLREYLYDNNDAGVDYTNGRYDYKILLQMPAQGILQAMGFGPYKSIYLAVGQPDSGKTTIIDLYSYFVGEDARCTIGLDEFANGDKFVMARKEGKLFNLHDDLGYFKMADSGRIKAMSGGYTHKIERKGKDAYDGHITTVDIYTANHTAGFNRNIYLDKAFWERWYYINFPNHFEQNDEFQKLTFTEENKSALLNEVIKTMLEIRKNKKLVVQKEAWTEVRLKWMQASNILYKFLEDNMVSGGKTSFIKDELFTALKAWCIESKQGEDLIPKSSSDLGDSVELCGGVGDAQRMFRNKGQNTHHCFVLPYTWKPSSKYRKYCPSEGVTDQDILDRYC
jgi:hypothetical protein